MAACFDQEVLRPVDEAVVGITYFHRTLQFMDRDNILASLKPAWDGFTHAGLWADDRDTIYLPVNRAKDAAKPRVEIVVFRSVPDTWQAFIESLSES